MNRSGSLFILAALAMAPGLAAQSTGEPLPQWTPGTLDIHQISTGRGNAALFILPDGTTLLVDAGCRGRWHCGDRPAS